MRTIHYIGMSESRYEAARSVYSEVSDSDVVIVGDPRMHKYVWDASAVDRRYTD